MNQDEYLKNRLEDQLTWYDNKSITYQKRFKLLRTLGIIIAALIPLVSSLPGNDSIIKLIMAGFGVSIVIIEGINTLNKYQELWIGYRTTAETLKHHKFLFETKSAPYEKNDSFSLLVENVETIISREHSNWNSMLKEKQSKTNTK